MEAAKFCRKCGALMSDQQSAVGQGAVDAEEETRVATRSSISTIHSPNERENHPVAPASPRSSRNEGSLAEKEIFTIGPTLMFVKGGYVLAALGALLLVALFSVFALVSPWAAVLIGLLLFLVPAYYHIRQKLVRYTLTESKLEIDSGFISRSIRSVPIRRIQDVTVAASVTQRLLSLGDLVIDNASEEGGKVVLKNINTPKLYADEVLGQMRRLEK